MIKQTLEHLRCPKMKKQIPCQGELKLEGDSTGSEVVYGELICKKCSQSFPILEGVAILVHDVRTYLLTHVKGISKFVPDSKIPASYRSEYLAYKDEIVEEHIEEDLESDRVNALYLMNHYLNSNQMLHKTPDPLIKELLSKYWDHGPFETVQKWISDDSRVVELGCGVGGLYRGIANRIQFYLGVDSSFQSILIARHLNLGTPYAGELKTPSDLLYGNRYENFLYQSTKSFTQNEQKVDFIVGDIDSTPLKKQNFDVSISLNAIDMLEEPKKLPEHQKAALKKGGIAIQSGPYIWHERIARQLRKSIPKKIQDSASAVEYLYEQTGFKVLERSNHIPWLFFKHGRQLELYSVHAFRALVLE